MKQALQALIDEMEYVLSCINEDKIPFDGDDFHAALRLGKEALAKQEQGEPVAWISVKDELPKAMRGVSYKASLTDTVLVLHSDRPDYPITAHAVVGEGLGAGVAIPTDGASEHPEIAWYSASCNLNNPFNLKNDDYERFLPKIFGKKITHWMPIPTTPQQRKPMWIDTNDKTQAQFLPHIGEPVLFCHGGKTYYGRHTGGSFQYGSGVTKRDFNTWECHWMPIPAAHGIKE